VAYVTITMNSEEIWILSNPGKRPPFAALAQRLWGDADFDSDGDAATPESDWTELTITRRPEYDQRVDVDPINDSPLMLQIRSATPGLALKAAQFLEQMCGGFLRRGK
jgi:hypothetical protein